MIKKVLTGLDRSGRVKVELEQPCKQYGYTKKWYKVSENKKGSFVTIDKKRFFIEIPKGEFEVINGSYVWISE